MMTPLRRFPQPARGASHAARGFTLIELLVTFVLLAVMLTLAAPSFLTFQRNAELTTSANSFVAALSAARAEAMKRQVRAFVIPGDGSAEGTNWAAGWVVFVDADNNVTGSSTLPTSADIVVAKQAALPGTVAVTANSFGDGTKVYVMFNGSGFMTKIDKTFADMSLDLANTAGETRRVIVNPNGRFRVCKPPPADSTCTESAL